MSPAIVSAWSPRDLGAHLDLVTIQLDDDERRALDGDEGPVWQKLMLTMALYAQAMGADRLVNLDAPGHLVISEPVPGVGARLEFLEELVSAGISGRMPFSVNPPAPALADIGDLSVSQSQTFGGRAPIIRRYTDLLLELGLRPHGAATCMPWLEEVGNKPACGQVIAWAESSAVVYANSVLGARTHRNPGLIDLVSNLTGRTPAAGLVTDEGRRATVSVDVSTRQPPDPQLLGYVLGRAVLGEVPILNNLGTYFELERPAIRCRLLHDIGTNAAVGGAVGLFHVRHVTPDALRSGDAVLAPGYRSLLIGDADLEAAEAELRAGVEFVHDSPPARAVLGCPHLSLEQIEQWTRRIDGALSAAGRGSLAVPTTIVTAPGVLAALRARGDIIERLGSWGVEVRCYCLEALMQDSVVAPPVVITNSNKLRYYNRGVMRFSDDALLRIIISGRLEQPSDRAP